MQQRELVRLGSKILMGFSPILNVGDRQKCMRRFFCEIVKHVWRAPERAANIGCNHREDKGWIDSSCSANIKFANRESTGPHVAQNIAGDEVARNNKENIDADEAAFEAAYLQVKQKYAGDSNGAQPSYLGAEMTMHEVSPSARIQRAT